MIFADTGWFVTLVNTDDSLHKRSNLWLRSIHDSLITTEYVLLETFNGLSAPAVRGRCHALVPPLVMRLGITVFVGSEDSLFERGVQLHAERPDKEWSLTDSISFIVMQRRGINSALSHDHHFEQAGFRPLLRQDP